MNCKKCSVELKDNAETCHICGIKQGEAFLPVITGNEWFSFLSNGNYTLKYKLNSNLEISCNGKVVGLLVHNNDDAKNNHYYDLVQSENNKNVIVRFVREDKTLTCVDPISGKVFFTWHCLSSAMSKLVSGSKWTCGKLSLSQNQIRCILMLIPRINFTIPTKYNVTEDGRIVGIIKGECFSFFNNKSVEVVDRLRNWELLASAIILSDDELG